MAIVRDILIVILVVFDLIVAVYLLIFFAINFWFAVLSWLQVGRRLQRERLRQVERDERSPFLPVLSLLVPAYNEEVTCVESIRSLLQLRYANFEVIICNDGSSDRTMEVLREAFGFERSDVNYRDELGTAPIRGLYRARSDLFGNAKRLVLIDKENGGKADALNAAINASQGAFVTSMDADSMLDPTSLSLAVQAIVDDPNNVIAIGAQVGIVNDSVVKHGQLQELRLPRKWIVRFQVVEYMRSFGQSRMALAEINSLLILSGVFALLRQDLVVAAGGFLSGRVAGKLVQEYCGTGAETVCEDMEIVVRLHRYLLDRNRTGVVAFHPLPVARTEAPESYRDLGRQRARWQRGLLEVLLFHRRMLLRPRYKQVGMFALPYQLLFEAVVPLVELAGYLLLPLSVLAGLVPLAHALAFLAFTIALHVAVNTFSVLRGLHVDTTGGASQSLFAYPRIRDTVLLLLASLLSNFGYRQYLLMWQLKGILDFVRRRKQWDKFARKGFGEA